MQKPSDLRRHRVFLLFWAPLTPTDGEWTNGAHYLAKRVKGSASLLPGDIQVRNLCLTWPNCWTCFSCTCINERGTMGLLLFKVSTFALLVQVALGDLIGEDVLSGQEDECTFVSASGKVCYFFRAKSLTFDSALSYCEKEFNATLALAVPSLDEEFILQSTSLPFWIGVKGKLTHDAGEEGGRLFFINEWINHRNYSYNHWDLSKLNLSLYWQDQVYCAEAVNSDYAIRWNPKNCSEESENVLCAKPFLSEDFILQLHQTDPPVETETPQVEVTQTQTSTVEPNAQSSFRPPPFNRSGHNATAMVREGQVSFSKNDYIAQYHRELLVAAVWVLILVIFFIAIAALGLFYRRRKWFTHKTSSTVTYTADSTNKGVSLIDIRQFPLNPNAQNEMKSLSK